MVARKNEAGDGDTRGKRKLLISSRVLLVSSRVLLERPFVLRLILLHSAYFIQAK